MARQQHGTPMAWTLRVTMPNGDQYDVPVRFIAEDRARHYADDYGGNWKRSLTEDTLPLFEAQPFEVEDWAANNMDWDDVSSVATKVATRPPLTTEEFQEGWINGDKAIIYLPDQPA